MQDAEARQEFETTRDQKSGDDANSDDSQDTHEGRKEASQVVVLPYFRAQRTKGIKGLLVRMC